MDSTPIGRDAEITEILTFHAAASGAPAAMVITGSAGIGKTVIWRHTLQAVGRSARVLSCRPAMAERPLAFSALHDLLGDVSGEILSVLSGQRRQAVEIALTRDTSPGSLPANLPRAMRPLPDRQVLARGILDVLRTLADSSPLVIAMDDTQWLDRPSAAVLEFCFRRLQHEPVCILLTLRSDDTVPLGLDRALPPDRLGRRRLGPLTLGAIGEILRSRLGAVLPRYALTRLYDTCGGNPFYAMECARALLDQPHASLTNEPIPVPQTLCDLVRHRVRRLAPEVRRVGWLVAASPNPRERQIRVAFDDGESWAAIDQAIDEGLIERDHDVLRFTHPLLRSVLYREMPPDERRQVHRQLGAVAEDTEERAWHLALGAERPSEEIAGLLDNAARGAALRGAPEQGATLAEQAVRLTPARSPEAIRERTVGAADFHFRAGGMARSQELIQSALATCPAGPRRAALLLRLATVQYHQHGWPLAEQTMKEAAQEAPDDPALRAHAEQELALARSVAGDLPAALHWAKTSLRSAELAGNPHLTAHSLARVAVFEFLGGNGVRLDLLNRAETLETSAGEEPAGRLPLFSPSLTRGIVLKWCDRLDEARLRIADQYRHALDRGNGASVPFLLYHFSELETWAGNWTIAEDYALEGRRVAEESRQQTMTPAALYSLALVRAHLGQAREARELASQALFMCEQTGNLPLGSQVLAVLGFIALSLDDHQAVHSHLGPLADITVAFGLGEPCVVRFLPDEIEALVILGQIDRARTLTRQLETQGRSLGRPWALATAARCRAQLAAADGDLPGARDACAEALSHHEQLPMPFELGRTLLTKGMVERRAKLRSAARGSFGQALDIFERLGAPLWTGKARCELSKLATRPLTVGLTDTEHRIAALIAQGLTNREIAAAMFVTSNTVQTHVRHIFQKLGVRSRTELAAQLLSAPAGTAATVTASPGR